MIYVYAVIAAALVPFLNIFFPVLQRDYSIWLVPVIFLGAFLGFIILHLAFIIAVYYTVKPGVVPKRRGFYRFLARISMPLIAKIMRIKVNVTGADNMPETKRVVMISNHKSVFDPVAIMAAFPEYGFAFMAKEEVKKDMPSIVARFISAQGGVFVDREDSMSGARALIDMIRLLKAGEISMGIFPEGKRNKGEGLLPFKPGAVKAAAKAGVPLVVCTLKGTARIPKNIPFTAKVDMDILKCYSPKEIAERGDEAVQNEAYEMMKENLEG